MVTAPTPIAPPTVILESPLPREVLTHLYETMLKARLLSRRIRKAPQIAEAVIAGTLQNAEDNDVIVSGTPHPVLEVLRGAEIQSVVRSNPSKLSKLDVAPSIPRIATPGSEVAAAVAAGNALAFKSARSSSVVIAFVSGKDTVGSAFRQGVRFAGEQRLPVVFVADWSGSRASRSHDGRNLSHWPCPTIAVDAHDVIAVYRVLKEATGVARRGHGPTLVDCINFLPPGKRGRNDRDPLASFRGYLKRHDAWSDEWASKLESDWKEQFGIVKKPQP